MRPAVFRLKAPKVVLPMRISTELRRTWPKPETYTHRSHRSVPFISTKRRSAAYLSYIASATSKFKLTTTLASNVGRVARRKTGLCNTVATTGRKRKIGSRRRRKSSSRRGSRGRRRITGRQAVPNDTGGGKGKDGIERPGDSKAGGAGESDDDSARFRSSFRAE